MRIKRIYLLLLITISLNAGTMQSFLDDSINSVTEEPGYYRFGVGCGGIDATFGGFSYLNADYLVEKLKAISAAAPAFAFQMALGVLCEDCKTTLNWLENIANQINNFNMDTCKASKRIGEFAADKLMTAIDGNMNSGQSNNFIEASEGAKSDQESTWGDYFHTMSYYMGSDTAAEETIKQATLQGSLVQEAIENASGVDVSILGNDPKGGKLFTSLVRAMVGDVVGYKSDISNGGSNEAGNGDGTPKLKFIPLNNVSFQSFLYGGSIDYIYVKTKDSHKGKPTVEAGTTNFTGIKNIYEQRLESILNQMKSHTSISSENRKFINSMPIPIAKYLNTSVLAAIDDINSLVEYLAIIETKAFLNFIVRTTSKTLSYEIINSSDDQNPMEVKEYLMTVNKNAVNFRDRSNKWFIESINEWKQNKTVNDYYIGLEQRLKSRLANSGTFNSSF